MSNATINKTVFFAASRETVWAYLTDKDKLGEWFYAAKTNLAAGEDYTLVGTADDGSESPRCWGTVLEMEAPARLVCSFTIKPLAGAMTTVSWTLDEVAGGTRLTLKHEGIEAAGDAALGLLTALDAGWDNHFKDLRARVKN